MDFKPILYVTGIFLSILAASMILPMSVDYYSGNDDWKVFCLCIIVTAFFGGSLVLSNANEELQDLSIRQTFMLTVMSWVFVAIFAAFPFCFSRVEMSAADAFFESMSGITTTGATIIDKLSDAPPGILLWRSLLQWLGGIGFVIMAISVLPSLRVGGMQLFRAESSEKENVLPSIKKLAGMIGFLYLGLTFLCITAYMIAGLDFFEAVIHAFSTISTGGFSSSDLSIGYFNNATLEVFAIIFMIIGGIPFILLLKCLQGKPRLLTHDAQVNSYFAIISVSTVIIIIYLCLHNGTAFPVAIRQTLFSVVSVITGTGYINSNYNAWGHFVACFMFFLMMIGGCAGSTTSGIKVFRFQILFALAGVQIKKLIHPHGTFIPQYNGHVLPKDASISVVNFFILFLVTYALITVALALTGVDIVTALSGAATTVSNMGLGAGEVIGPGGSFKPLPDSAKWIMSVAMLLGRLEFFTIFVMFSPYFWKK